MNDMSGKQVIVTTSWDDGHVDDLRVAALLKKYGVTGTFYVSPRDHAIKPAERLTARQIKALAADFEIGAHTMTHPHLTDIPDTQATYELRESKRYLERLIRRPVTTFCYPGGDYARRHARMARDLGFTYARTTRRHSTGFDHDVFRAGTTVNTFTHYQDLWKIARFARFNPVKIYRYLAWDELAIAMFDRVRAEGGVFHLWGHSWIELSRHDEGLTGLQRRLLHAHRLIEPHGDRDGYEMLERVLRHIGGHGDVRYITNGELPALKPRNLLIAAPYFPPHPGGQEFYAYNLARRLHEDHGWQVTVATAGKRGPGWKPVRTERTTGPHTAPLEVYELPTWYRLSNTPVNPLWRYSLKRLMKSRGITVVNAHEPVPYLAEAAETAAGTLPVVLTYHMTSMKKGLRRYDWLIGLFEDRILPKRLKHVQSVVCSSDAVRDDFLPGLMLHSDVSTMTISPGVDVQRFRPALRKPGNTGPTLLFNGSLEKTGRHKGLWVLLDCLPALIERVPKLRLEVVGFGDGREDYEAQAARLGISTHVTFHGAVFDQPLVRLYQQADIFVLPSLNDSYPMVIPEAMATGLPVVSTRVGAIPTVVRDGVHGYIVPPGDQTALTRKLLYLLEHPEKARSMGRAGRRKAEREMSWEEKAAVMNELLLEAQGNA